ncbi:MAG: hypothetical protein HC800_03805 [Phormidesmis sp. RL_2_1]|nr:hypothetical protein [Phormidesmis sp. RL_2_1]
MGSGKQSRQLFAGLVLLSLVVHSLVLKLPWPLPLSSDTLDPAADLWDVAPPPGIAIAPLPPQITTQVSPAAALSPQQPRAFPLLATGRPAQSAQPSMAPLGVQPSTQRAEPAQISQSHEPIPAHSQQQPVVEPTGTAASAPTPSPTAPTTPDDTTPDDTTPEAGKVVRLGDDFPHLQAAQSGCYGLEHCHRIDSGGRYRTAAKQLQNQMIDQGYQVKERDDVDEPGHLVFEVITPNEPEAIYYLNVFSDSAGSTVYVLTTDIVSLGELQQLRS